MGRALEVKPFNVRTLGKDAKLMREGGIPLPAKTDDVWLLTRAWSTPDGFIRGARLVGRTASGLVRGRQLVGMGGALSASLMPIIKRRNIPVWLRAPLQEIILEHGRVGGAVVERNGTSVRVRAHRAIMLAAGGFARNAEWRKQYQGIEGWTSAPVGQMGQGIAAGAQAGGALAMMEDAWWGSAAAAKAPSCSPSAPTPGASWSTSAAVATSTSRSRTWISAIT